MAISLGPNQALARSRFQSQLAFGQIAETQIARWLLARGNDLLPIYDKEYDTGKGPRIFFHEGDLVAPDFFVLKGSAGIHWIEAKHKTVFTWFRKHQRWTTGIDQHHYEQYLKVKARFNYPVWLLFLHESPRPDARDLRHGCPPECPTGLFGDEIGNLDGKINHRAPPVQMNGGWGRSGMVYWAHERLRLIASLAEVRACSILWEQSKITYQFALQSRNLRTHFFLRVRL